MNRARSLSFLAGLLSVALSTACLALFPASPESTPTEQIFKPVLTPLEFDPPSLPDARVGLKYEVEIKITGNVTPVGDFQVDPKALPPGLELIFEEDGTDTARITGVPEAAGTYTFRIHVWCFGTQVSGQTGAQEYTIVVE